MKSTYNELENELQEKKKNLYEKFWNIKSSPRALHFPWNVLLNRIATRDNLIKIWVDVISRECVMCGRAEETFQYQFFNCI